MIRGLSYQNGIFYIGFKHIACSEMKSGEIVTTVRPISFSSLVWLVSRILLSVPILYYLLVLAACFIVAEPALLQSIPFLDDFTLPWTIFLLSPTFAHLLFPNRLKKFHGAEHKVFSFKGKVTMERFNDIKRAEITNRYCSTNFVVGQLVVLILLLLLQVPLFWSALGAAIGAVVLQQLRFDWLEKCILFISYPLQRWVTTKEPDDNHINVAIHSYSALMSAKNNA